jgi:transcription initiation factor TFIIIB Brf1 subunit/transcription initiation factor TFIIB
MITLDEALRFADMTYTKQSFAGILAAEVRRLREENERLRIENAALREDSARIDWLADVNNTVGSVVLPRHIVEQNISSLRQAIDEAMTAKTTQEPAP